MKRPLALAVASSLVTASCAAPPAGAPPVVPSIEAPPEHAAPMVDLRATTTPASRANTETGEAPNDAASDEPRGEVATPAPSAGADAGFGNASPSKPPDPLAGVFTLADATSGLPKKGKLIASIVTDLGALRCTLFADRAPVTVAAFVGLARGVRPWLTPNG